MNGNFTLLLKSSGQEWQFYSLLLTSSGQEWQFYSLLLTSSGQEWQFQIATDIWWSRMAILFITTDI